MGVRTTKAISTISFNSKEFLELKLNELIKSKIISFWCFITHEPEEDEKKEHHHVYIIPSKMIQTDDLREFLIQHNEDDPSRPFGCLMFNPSKFDDWFLYGLHDPEYLASKGQGREHYYSQDDFICSSYDDFDEMIKKVDKGKLSPYIAIRKAKENGMSFSQYIQTAGVNINQLHNFQRAWELVTPTLNRNNRTGHE